MCSNANGPSTRWSLIEGAIHGDVADREAFAARYATCVRAYLRARSPGRGLDPELLEDVEQEVWFQLFKAGGALSRLRDDRAGFRAFLFGIVRNVARDALRSDQRLRARTVPIGASGEDGTGIEVEEAHARRAFDRAWAAALCAEARDLLARERSGEEAGLRLQVMEMRYGSGLVPRTIAARTGLPSERVHRLLTRGRAEFRSALLTVLAGQAPRATRAELEEQLRDVLAGL